MATPESFFREAVDLNRYSNSVARKFVESYNDVLVAATNRLRDIELSPTRNAPLTRKRLRALIADSKKNLNAWAKTSSKAIQKDLQGITKLQAEFIEGELRKAVSNEIPVNSIVISPDYAEKVVSTDPTKLNLFGRPEEEFKKYKAKTFELTADQGKLLTLPNGETVEKAFRGVAVRQQESFARHIRQGILSGETNVQIASRMIGRLKFGQEGSLKQVALAGGELTKIANHQVSTIVRTSINQVTNAASQSVYSSNRDITPKYEYVATLDSRTSSTCQRLDGQEFTYDKGPTPPQHFNCRSTTVPVINYKRLGLTPPEKSRLVTRPSQSGRVDQKISYGEWLYEQRALSAKGKMLKYEPNDIQIEVLGYQKAKYFNRLAAKTNGKDALRAIIRSDGSELTLEQLRAKYGKPENIKPASFKPAKKKTTKKKDVAVASGGNSGAVIGTENFEMFAKSAKKANGQEFIDESIEALIATEGLTGKHGAQMKEFLKKYDIINNFNMKGDRWNFNQAYERIVVKNKKAYDAAVASGEATMEKFATSTYFSKGRPYGKVLFKGLKEKNTASNVFKQDFKFCHQPAGGSCSGYTSMYSAVVNTEVSYQAKLINKKAIKEMKEKSAKVLKTNKAYADYYKEWDLSKPEPAPEIFSNSSALDQDFRWFSTMIHEIGHQIHFKGTGAGTFGNKFKKLGGMKYVTGYSRKNPRELFAESYVQYVLNPEGMQETAPRLYKWVEETIQTAMEAQ